jgi:DNA-binding winged helix-turn-helix (wHTH) protein
VDVVLLRWPVEQARREEARRAGQPRLLLVENGAPAPLTTDELEDWIRIPAVDADLRARVQGLRQRTASRAAPEPVLDDDGVLRLGDRWVALPPVEARLTAALIDRFGAVVSRSSLAKAGWPDGAPGRNALDVHVLRLRRRLTPLGLAIRTVRSRGYLLERAVPDALGASDGVQERVREA